MTIQLLIQRLEPLRYAAIAFFSFDGEQYCPSGSGSGSSSSSSSSDSSSGSSDSSSSGSSSGGGGKPASWLNENIYRYFTVCEGRERQDVALIVLLPMLEVALVLLAYRSVLISTIRTVRRLQLEPSTSRPAHPATHAPEHGPTVEQVKYFSVACAVEQVDNDIIGDIEQARAPA